MKSIITVIYGLLLSSFVRAESQEKNIIDLMNQGGWIELSDSSQFNLHSILTVTGVPNQLQISCEHLDFDICDQYLRLGSRIKVNQNLSVNEILDLVTSQKKPGQVWVDCTNIYWQDCKNFISKNALVWVNQQTNHYDILAYIRASFSQPENVTVDCRGAHLFDCRKYASLGATVIADPDYDAKAIRLMIRYHPTPEYVFAPCNKVDVETCRQWAVNNGSIIAFKNFSAKEIRKVMGSQSKSAKLVIHTDGFLQEELLPFANWEVKFVY